jgi:hypothetical protein
VCDVSNSNNVLLMSMPAIGASSNHTCAMFPTIAMGESRLLLLGHHGTDGIAATGHLSVVIEGYRPMLQRCIVIVYVKCY